MGDTSMNGFDSEATAVSAKIMVIAMIVMFFMVAFFFFLCIYAKWYWSRSEHPLIRSWRGGQPQLVPNPAQRRGLDHGTLQSLPILVYNSKDFKEVINCSVCLSDVSQGEKIRVLPKCNHGYHLECIDMWFKSHSTCPLCRNLVSNSPKAEVVDSGRELVEVGVSSVEASASSSRVRDELVIEIPRNVCNDCLSSPPSTTGFSEEEPKTPVMSRLRSLKRMLSRGKRVATTSSSDDVEVV